MQTRKVAAGVILKVLKGASLATALPPALAPFSASRDSAFIQALCYGTCRWYFELTAILSQLLPSPLKSKDQDIHVLIVLGLFQLIHSDIPPHAAITETVASAPLHKTWAKKLINAILRRCQREMPFAKHSAHPDWLEKKLRTDWPCDYETIMDANNQPPPFSLRVNLQKISRENYLTKLLQKGLKAYPLPETSAGIRLEKPMPVTQVPYFKKGWVSVQDGAAQLAAELLAPAAGERILDACAAPGGKTTHLLESEPLLNLTAIDRDAKRLNQIKENLKRLNLHCTLIEADAGNLSTWWDGQHFDRILLDAPCSASGVIRRHPDIRLLRQESNIKTLAKEQLRLLHALWPTLKSGGVLLYATCSIFPEENTKVIQTFLNSQQDADEKPLRFFPKTHSTQGLQILPGIHDMDGFYYALLRRT